MDRAQNQPSHSRTESSSFLNKLRDGIETKAGKLAASTVIAFGVATLSACATTEAAPPAPTTSQETEAPATPSETPVETTLPEETTSPEVETDDTRPGAENLPAVTPENEAEIIEQLRISADLSPEEIAQKIIENDDHWAMFGATPETWYNQDYSISLEEYAQQVADGNTHAMAVAMFGETYATDNNQEVDDYVSGMSGLNYGNLDRFLRSYGDEENPNSNTENKETFDQGVEYIDHEVILETEDTLVLDIIARDYNNGARTMFQEYDQYNDYTGTTRFTLTQQGNYYVITAAVSVNN